MLARMRGLPPLALAVLVAFSCAGSPEPAPIAPPPCPPEEPTPAEPKVPGADLPPPRGAEGTLVRLDAREQVPLVGPRVDARPGDFLLATDGHAAVVSAERGYLVDFAPKNARDALVSVQPVGELALDAAPDDVVRIEPTGEHGNVLRVVRKIREKPIFLVTFYWLASGAVHIETAAVGAPDTAPIEPGPIGLARRLPALAVALGERVFWGNVPTWAEGLGPVGAPATRLTDFVARDGFGTAYALCVEGGPLYARFGVLDGPGFFEPALSGERVVPVPVGGASERRRVAITHSDVSSGDAVLALPCAKAGPTRRIALPLVPARGAHAELSRCDRPERRLFAHFAVDQARFKGTSHDIDLPEGCFEARLGAPGHAPGPWVRVESLADAARDKLLPTAGKLKLVATEGGKPVPARLYVRGTAGTPDPDWGDDYADGNASLNVAYTEHGEGEWPLPPGKYHVAVGRGFEYTAHEQDVVIKPGGTVEIRAALERVVDTHGWITADLHLHAEPSPDAPSRLADRIRSLVAVGVEAAVATDHNAVTDYGPVIRDLHLEGSIASVVGDEVTTRDLRWGHFNVFPLVPSTLPLAWVGVLPAELFADARAQKPYGPQTLVQVNHPRMGNIGYFDVLRFDPQDVKGWLARAPVADMGFDLLEVFNGDHHARISAVETVMRDWYALLDAGFHVVATGNSDSHKVGYHEAGMPRNLVFVGKDAPSAFDEATFVEALRQGKVVVQSGPFVRLEVAGKGVGETVPEGEAEIVVRVDAPPWVDVDRIELLRKGKPLKSWPVTARKGPVEQRTRETLQKGDWIIAIARGSKPMDVYAPGAQPFGFTNPVFVR
jgi:hypothetical protein